VQEHDNILSTKCPHCGYEIDSVVNVTESKDLPSEGDISICIMCAGVAKYGDNRDLIMPTEFDLALWDSNPEVKFDINRTVRAIKKMNKTK
jgi:hypothetical protein